MQCYNPFYLACNTVQDALFRSAGSLQQMRYGSADEASAARQQATDAVLLFHRQLQAIEALFIPAADPYEPAIADAVLQLHAVAITGVQEVLATLQKEKEIFIWAQTFRRVMVQLMGCLLRSEALLLPVLSRYYSDAELKRLENRLTEELHQPQQQRA